MDERTEEKIKGIIGSLEAEAKKRVGTRTTIERRWLDDLRQYHGSYDEAAIKRMKDKKGSSLFVNMTGPKTDAMSARLMDLLFPSDERNWSIQQTPVPELSDVAKEAIKARREAEAGDDPEMAAQAAEVEASVSEINDQAKQRCDRMADKIDDQLKASSYAPKMRDVIEDACKYGTGICKGPVSGAGLKRKWVKGEEGYTLSLSSQNQPGYEHVDIWSFFPPMNQSRIENCDGFYERHLMTKKQVRRLQHREDFNKDGIRRVLSEEPRKDTPWYFAEMQGITGEKSTTNNAFYQVWEYTGALETEDMRFLADALDPELAADMGEDIDPLQENHVVVWFCQNEILKFAIHPMDSQEAIYSVYNVKKDESSLFGYGIPHIMRDPQSMLNAGLRMMMDNSGFSAGPHIIIDKKAISPVDGDWSLRGPKIWEAKDGIPRDAPPFQVMKFDSNQGELANIMLIAKQHIDDETGLNKLNQGDGQDTPQSKTFGGTALLMNASNVVFRRMVKNFDDDVTVPNIRRLYDWNMQHNDDDKIKGDYEVVAIGSSSFLMREMQAQNLSLFNAQYAGHPIFGPMLKHRDMLRETIKANSLSHKTIMLADEKIDEIQKQIAESEGQEQGDPVKMKELELKELELEVRQSEMDGKIAIAEMERDTKLRVAGLSVDGKMMELAEKSNIARDEKVIELAEKQEEEARKDDRLAFEAEMTALTGQTAGGRV